MHDNRWARWNLAAGRRERATNKAETYLILKTCDLLTDRQASLRALEIISKIFLFFFFWRGYNAFVKRIYFYMNHWVSKILFLCYYSGIKNEMLQLFTCEILHLFLLIKKKTNLSSYRPPVFYRRRRVIVGIGCGFKTFVLCQRYRINLIFWFMTITPLLTASDVQFLNFLNVYKSW